jgi:hypothetical protein
MIKVRVLGACSVAYLYLPGRHQVNYVVFAVLVLLVAGCASPEVSKQVAVKMRCTQETPTGSLLPVTRCRSEQQAQSEADAAEKALQRSRSVTTAPTQ